MENHIRFLSGLAAQLGGYLKLNCVHIGFALLLTLGSSHMMVSGLDTWLAERIVEELGLTSHGGKLIEWNHKFVLMAFGGILALTTLSLFMQRNFRIYNSNRVIYYQREGSGAKRDSGDGVGDTKGKKEVET